MNWEEWCKKYPCLQAKKLPTSFDQQLDDRAEAEHVKDLLEDNDQGLPYRVVEFENKFFVVTKFEACELTGLSECEV